MPLDFFAGGPGFSCPDTWYHGFYQILTDKKHQNLTACAGNLIMGCGWIFHLDPDPKTNIKINTNMCH